MAMVLVFLFHKSWNFQRLRMAGTDCSGIKKNRAIPELIWPAQDI
jgi:hypothetical protein